MGSGRGRFGRARQAPPYTLTPPFPLGPLALIAQTRPAPSSHREHVWLRPLAREHVGPASSPHPQSRPASFFALHTAAGTRSTARRAGSLWPRPDYITTPLSHASPAHSPSRQCDGDGAGGGEAVAVRASSAAAAASVLLFLSLLFLLRLPTSTSRAAHGPGSDVASFCSSPSAPSPASSSCAAGSERRNPERPDARPPARPSVRAPEASPPTPAPDPAPARPPPRPRPGFLRASAAAAAGSGGDSRFSGRRRLAMSCRGRE